MTVGERIQRIENRVSGRWAEFGITAIEHAFIDQWRDLVYAELTHTRATTLATVEIKVFGKPYRRY